MKQNIFIEIENLISDTSRRSRGDFEIYNSEAEFDTRHDDYVEVFNQLNGNWDVILFSSRRERERYKIEKWLDKHEVDYEELLLRPDIGFSKDWKSEFLVDYYNGNLSNLIKKTQLFITSDEKLAEEIKDLGVKVLRC